ncbi:MAG: TIGR03960 family B12-binding radical SAM protein [Desulforegulaceae bacterium]|nr:TIGR03960 family B12-binding radical SAM protein [Desulforegulaceae bacterium]
MRYKQMYLNINNPGNYLGNEVNSVKKNEEEVDLNFALAFPDLYEIGSSHFGIQILYDILNNHKDIYAQRVFVPSPDMRDQLKENKVSIGGLETKKPLKEFDIIGFSLLYELNYTGILEILDLGNIPFYSSQRDETYPLVIAGGPCMVNPEPVADFFDFVFVGDGEEAIIEISEKIIEWKKNKNRKKYDLLYSVKDIKGVYVPIFFEDKNNENLFLDNVFPDYKKINKRIVSDLENAPFPVKPIIPYGRPVHDRLRLEISRGCTRGCRFCQAGMIYRPVRERSVQKLLEIAEKSIENTGYEDLSLLSLSTGDYTCFPELLFFLMKRYMKEARSVSLPSIRAGRLTKDLMEEIQKVRKTGFTIAPEAGSQRLRDVINKDLSEEEIVGTVKSAFDMGWQIIKLYFMTGLPSETKEDLDELILLVKKLKFLPEARRSKINVSLTTFIPKPHTPFQWERLLSREESMANFLYLKNNLKINGVNVKWQDPEHTRLEGLFSRGDRSLSPLIVKAYENGCHLDGWTEHFKYEKWIECIESLGIDIDSFIGKRNTELSLPWDKIDIGVTKKYLLSELDKSKNAIVTQDCRISKCSGCGVCDFKTIYPKVFDKSGVSDDLYNDLQELENSDENIFRLKILFEKTGNAAFFGHLELIGIFQRAFDRSKLKFDFSKGFHPKPKMNFKDALPLGMESYCEFMTIDCYDTNIENLLENLNKTLPNGLFVKDIEKREKKYKFYPNYISIYEVNLNNIENYVNKINEFNLLNDYKITLLKKKKPRIYDLKYWFSNIEITGTDKIKMKILSENGKTLRPDIFLNYVLNLSKEETRKLKIYKIKEMDKV